MSQEVNRLPQCFWYRHATIAILGRKIKLKISTFWEANFLGMGVDGVEKASVICE